MMKAILHTGLFVAATLAVLVMPGGVASAKEAQLQTPDYQFNTETIIRGGKLFARNCSACHSLSNLRYNRLTKDLGLGKEEIAKDFMLPAGAKYLEGMKVTMPPRLSKKWFGTTPPDLSLVGRYRGVDWIYTYLRSFYWDPKMMSGWNNHVFPAVAMPNVLYSYSGIVDKQGKVLQKGSISPQDFKRMTADLTAWLQYVSDPSKITRNRIGPYVIGFLLIFTLLAYFMKRAYWRDIHSSPVNDLQRLDATRQNSHGDAE